MSRTDYDVRLLRAAEDDLAEIVTYIAVDRPSPANALADRMEKDIGLLATSPLLGRVPKESALAKQGYRYLVIENYLVFYTIEKRTVLVHRILHGARDYVALL